MAQGDLTQIEADELAQIEAQLTELNEREAGTRPRPLRATHGRPRLDQRELAELRSFAEADPEIRKLGAFLTRLQKAQQKALLAWQAETRAEAEKHKQAVAASDAAGIAERKKALELLEQPHTSWFIGLTRPILILQQPKSEPIFVDSHIEPLNSWLKVHVDANDGQDNTNFIFYFIWTNPSEFFAVVNVESFLTLNGQWRAWGDTGVFSGDTAELILDAHLAVRRWTGWGTDPATGQDFFGTYYPLYLSEPWQNIITIDAYGGETYFPNPPMGGDFDPNRFYNLTGNYVGVPGYAVMIVEVGLRVWYRFMDGGEGNGVQVDLFYDPLDYKVRCPQVVLEINIPAEP